MHLMSPVESLPRVRNTKCAQGSAPLSLWCRLQIRSDEILQSQAFLSNERLPGTSVRANPVGRFFPDTAERVARSPGIVGRTRVHSFAISVSEESYIARCVSDIQGPDKLSGTM